MELSFILTALRQRGWIIAVALVLGAFAARSIDQPVEDRYRSEVLLLVAPPSARESVFNENLDRYVQGEMSVLESDSLAAQVATAVGPEVTASEVRRAADFDQVPRSNVVEISATTEDPALAPAIASAYAELYLARTTAQEQADLSEELRIANERIVELADEIAALDATIQAAVAPFIAQQGLDDAPPVPDPRLLIPDVVTRRELRLTEYNQLLSRRIQLAEEERSTATSQVVQPATDPEPVAVESVLPIRLAIMVVAGLLGLILALLSTQFRKRFRDERQGEAVLGRRVAARLPSSRQLRRSPLAALGPPPRSHSEDIRRLWAQTERLGPLDETLVIAVTGAQRRAGTTTVALELARRFAASGRRTVVVDGDGDDPWLSEAFDGGRNEGAIERILAGDDPGSALAPTGDENLSIAGRTPGVVTPLHREGIRDLIEAMAPHVDVIVVDSGAALSSASAYEACAAAHAVVLTAPLARMTEAQLEEVVFELSEVADRVLPVVTLPSRRRGSVNLQRRLELPSGVLREPGELSAGRLHDVDRQGDDQVPGAPHAESA